MREGWPFTIYAHPKVLSILEANGIFNVLSEKTYGACRLRVDNTFEPNCLTARRLELKSSHSPFPAKARGIWKARFTPPARTVRGDTIGLRVRDKASGKYFYFLAPARPSMTI